MSDHTTMIEEMGVEQCNFCGAHREISTHAVINHFINCPVPNGDEAVANELAIINHIAGN